MDSGGAAARMVARIAPSVLRAGSGIASRYSSTVFGALLLFAAAPRLADFAFFMWAMLQELAQQHHRKRGPRGRGCCNIEDEPSSTATLGCVALIRAGRVGPEHSRSSKDDDAEENPAEIARSPSRHARGAADRQGAAFHAASFTRAYHPDPPLQLGLHLFQ